MRSRLAFTLSFWMLGAVALSVLAMGGLTAWNLGQGFSAYLQARDLERLDQFTALVAGRLAARAVTATHATDTTTAAADAEPTDLDMPALLHQLAVLDGGVAADSPRPERRPPPGRGPLRPRPPPHGGPDAFGARITLLHPDGRRWAGPTIAADEPGVVERPVLIDGAVVAQVRLRPQRRAPEASETRFLRTQYIGIAAVGTLLLLLALGAAIWLARQWVRPLAAVQEATARMARGERQVRVPTDRRDEIGDVVRNVNRMAESLERMEGARRRWLADLSHELRTPLTTLRGDIEALVDGVRPLDAAAVRLLREDALRLSALVDDLHLLSMADLQALPCHFAPADAAQLLQALAQRHAAAAQRAGLTLEIDLGEKANAPANTPANARPNASAKASPNATPGASTAVDGSASPAPAQAMPVLWDAGRVAQLLDNLVHNSLRYTDAPGRIQLGLHRAGGRIHIRIDDSAPGVAAEDLPRLFEPLYRADAARSRRHGGSGLGLAICAAIAQAHGGAVQASASPLGGLRIAVWLPEVAAA